MGRIVCSKAVSRLKIKKPQPDQPAGALTAWVKRERLPTGKGSLEFWSRDAEGWGSISTPGGFSRMMKKSHRRDFFVPYSRITHQKTG